MPDRCANRCADRYANPYPAHGGANDANDAPAYLRTMWWRWVSRVYPDADARMWLRLSHS